MINTNTLARPYAKAAFEFASAAQQADAWLNMLSLSAAAVQAPAMAQQLINPALTDEQEDRCRVDWPARRFARGHARQLVGMSMADTLYDQELPALVRSGAVPQSVLDEAVNHVLTTKYDLGLFHDPFRRIGRAEDDPADVNAESRLHRADARAMARDSLVLLENHDDTLSGGGNIIISVGEGCLIGANAGIGIPLGDRNTVEAGLYITAGTKVNLLDEGNALVKVVKARDLAGQPDLLFRRNSLTGAVECKTHKSAIELNEALHAHN